MVNYKNGFWKKEESRVLEMYCTYLIRKVRKMEVATI